MSEPRVSDRRYPALYQGSPELDGAVEALTDEQLSTPDRCPKCMSTDPLVIDFWCNPLMHDNPMDKPHRWHMEAHAGARRDQ